MPFASVNETNDNKLEMKEFRAIYKNISVKQIVEI